MPEMGEKIEGFIKAKSRDARFYKPANNWNAGICFDIDGKVVWINSIGGNAEEAMAPFKDVETGDYVRVPFVPDERGKGVLSGKVEKVQPPKVEGKEDYREYQKRRMKECIEDANNLALGVEHREENTVSIAVAFFNKRCRDKFYFDREQNIVPSPDLEREEAKKK